MRWTRAGWMRKEGSVKISAVYPKTNRALTIVTDDGRIGEFDVSPYLVDEAFEDLNTISEFMKVTNGGYFIEWDCGADLSADTIEAHMKYTNLLEANQPP